MTKAGIQNIKGELIQSGRRIGLQLAAMLAMLFCTLLGYKVHEVATRTDVDSWIGALVTAISSSVSAFFRMDPILSMLLVPALMVGGLALGGLYLWNSQGR